MSRFSNLRNKKEVQQFQNYDSQCHIAKTLAIASSTVHNIIKRFWKSVHFSVRTGHKQTSVFVSDPCDPSTSIKRHDAVMEITPWAQTHVHKSVSVNTVHCDIRRYRLKFTKKMFCDSSEFKIILGIKDSTSSGLKRRGSAQFGPAWYKPASLMVRGCISACGTGNLHIWNGTISAERYIQILEHHMPLSRWCLFQGGPCKFQQHSAKPRAASW